MNVKFQKNSENTVELVKFSCARCEFGGWGGHNHPLFILTFILGYNDLFIKWFNKSNKKRVFGSN